MEKLDNAIRLLREDLKRGEHAGHKDDDKHLQAEGDVTIGASSNIAVGNKAKQKTDVALRNELGVGIGDHLALDIDVKDLSATQGETKVYRMETECLETIPGLSRKLPFQSEKQLQQPHSNTTKYAKFQTKTKTGVDGEMRRISDQRLAIPYQMLPSISSEMTSQPTRLNIENAKFRDRKMDAGKTETKISDQISAMFDDTTYPTVMKSQRPSQCHATNGMFKDRKTEVGRTVTTDQNLTMSLKTLPPLPPGPTSRVKSGDGNQHMPTLKFNFDDNETTPDETPQEFADNLEESLSQNDSTSTIVGLDSISPPSCVSEFGVGSSKGLSGMNESIEMFTNTSLIRYDAITVVAEIQMKDLRESYLDWQKKFLKGPVHRKIEGILEVPVM